MLSGHFNQKIVQYETISRWYEAGFLNYKKVLSDFDSAEIFLHNDVNLSHALSLHLHQTQTQTRSVLFQTSAGNQLDPGVNSLETLNCCGCALPSEILGSYRQVQHKLHYQSSIGPILDMFRPHLKALGEIFLVFHILLVCRTLLIWCFPFFI